LPTNICSAVFPAYTPESTKRSRRQPSGQSFPIEDKKQDKLSFVFVDVSLFFWLLNVVRIWGCGDSYFSSLFILRGKFSYWVVSYFNRHILSLGDFHSLSCFLSSIGKLWADGCLRDLLVMIIFLISTSYLTIYQLAHYCTELKSSETTKWPHLQYLLLLLGFYIPPKI
jgi:hypothetical protein